ncbi:hypothetical protein CsatB_010819 [Cannabis sativa]
MVHITSWQCSLSCRSSHTSSFTNYYGKILVSHSFQEMSGPSIISLSRKEIIKSI